MDSSILKLSDLYDPLRRTSKFLDEHNVPFVLIGGMALAVYGQPRSTADVDVIIACDEAMLEQQLEQDGRPLFLFTPDLLTFPHMRIYRLQIKEEKRLVTVDMIAVDSQWAAAIVQRAMRIQLNGMSIQVASAEDIILLKLFSERAKDAEDIHMLILQRGEKLDRIYLEQQSAILGTQARWRQYG